MLVELGYDGLTWWWKLEESVEGQGVGCRLNSFLLVCPGALTDNVPNVILDSNLHMSLEEVELSDSEDSSPESLDSHWFSLMNSCWRVMYGSRREGAILCL